MERGRSEEGDAGVYGEVENGVVLQVSTHKVRLRRGCGTRRGEGRLTVSTHTSSFLLPLILSCDSADPLSYTYSFAPESGTPSAFSHSDLRVTALILSNPDPAGCGSEVSHLSVLRCQLKAVSKGDGAHS